MTLNPINGPMRLEELRKDRRITLRELGEKLEISPTKLCRIEKGEKNPEPELLNAICDVLELGKEDRDTLLWGFGYMAL